MGILDYFKRAPTTTAEEVRKFLVDKGLEEYNLIDVRQPAEYESGHIHGARLIPVGELPDRIRELDPDKPTIAY